MSTVSVELAALCPRCQWSWRRRVHGVNGVGGFVFTVSLELAASCPRRPSAGIRPLPFACGWCCRPDLCHLHVCGASDPTFFHLHVGEDPTFDICMLAKTRPLTFACLWCYRPDLCHLHVCGAADPTFALCMWTKTRPLPFACGCCCRPDAISPRDGQQASGYIGKHTALK